MTVSIALATVADSIAGLSITGITIKDIDQIPDNASMLCPLLIPRPDGFVTDISPSFESFGSGGTAKMNLEYTLNYVFLHSQIGSGINTYATFSDLISKLVAIIAKIMANDAITGAVDIQVQSIGEIGVVNDPAENEYWGVPLAFRVKEFVNG